MKGLKKVTMFLPEELVDKAKETTGEGLTETVRQGLELLAARGAYQKVLELRGKVDLKLDIRQMRKDKR